MESIPEELKGVLTFTSAEITRERIAAIDQMFEGVATERNDAIEQLMSEISAERTETLEQALEGLKRERVGLLKDVAQSMFWIELEMEALVIRMFLAFAGLIILWFSLRLVFRYWVDRVANNYLKTIGVLLLIIITSASIILVNSYLITMVTPDFSKRADFENGLVGSVEQVHGEQAD